MSYNVYTYIVFNFSSVISDYMAVPPNVTFGVNMTSSALRIPLVNDDTAEPDEQFTVNLADITPNIVIATFTADVTIIDDDRELHNSLRSYVYSTLKLFKSPTYILH